MNSPIGNRSLRSSKHSAQNGIFATILAVTAVLGLSATGQVSTPKRTLSTPESTAAEFIKDLRQGCEAEVRRDPSHYDLPPANDQLAWVWGTKKRSEKELMEALKQSYLTSCFLDQFEVTFTGPFPSSAIVTNRLTKEGIMPGSDGKPRIFNCYQRYTYEYTGSQWIIRKLEGRGAK